MAATVYFGSILQTNMTWTETLPAKLDLILERLKIRERVKDKTVLIKMHLGGNVGYSTVHPVFVRRVVQAVKEGGGRPFVTDTQGAEQTAHERGYSAETLGCPLIASAGFKETHFYVHRREYKNAKEWRVAGAIQEADFLIGFAHVKGHPSCGLGGAIKNIALGCMQVQTRGQMHDTFHYDRYWFKDKCPDAATAKKVVESCPFGAMSVDRNDPMEVHLHCDPCNQCMRCLKAAPAGSLKIDPVNFASFQEACAISTGITLSTFAPENVAFLNLATQITPWCDCCGFTTASVMPDIGIFGCDDPVAIDQATLDVMARHKLIYENIPRALEAQPGAGHPLQELLGPLKDPYRVNEYCEREGVGTRQYQLEDVFPVKERGFLGPAYIPAAGA
jgi:hypothetical protein